jgi:thymidylate synthase (FAD)
VQLKWHVKLPIFVARQWMRHRAGSFNEVSARYSERPEEFYEPTKERFALQSTTNRQGSGEPLDELTAWWAQDSLRANRLVTYDRYKFWLSKGIAREQARMVLPTNLYTEFYWSVNLRNFLAFLELRLAEDAQWEIRQYAQAMLDLAEPLFPLSLAAFRDYVLDGVRLSRMEADIVRRMVRGESWTREEAEGLSTRELGEFEAKLWG